MAFIKQVKLPNGIQTNYHVITDIAVENNKNIIVTVSNFLDEDTYKMAIRKLNLVKEQQALIDEFTSINSKSKKSKKDNTKTTELFNKINKLANEIDSTTDFSQFILTTKTIELPYTEDFSIINLEKLIDL